MGTFRKTDIPITHQREHSSFGVIQSIPRRRWLYLPRLFSRREKVRLVSLVVIALIAFGILATRVVARITVVEPAIGGVLREGITQEPRFINPLYASTDTDRALSSLVFSKIVRYDAAGAIALDLAENIEISEDGKAYTVTLRKNVQWHDGELVTAEDVVFTIKMIQNPDYQSPLRSNWQGVTAEKLNDHTVRLVLQQPYAPFLENLNVAILPEHLWKRISQEAATLTDLNVKPVGSGPYKFQKFTRRNDGRITSIALERNPHYHLSGPYLEEIHFIIKPDDAELLEAYQRGEIDSFLLASGEHIEALSRMNIAIHEILLPKVFAVFLNGNSHTALSRQPVREALALAIDREALVRETAVSGGVVVNGPLPPSSFAAAGDLLSLKFDPAEAAIILADDGWKDGDGDGVLERTQGTATNATTQKLEIKLATSDAPELARATELIKKQWEAIGVKTDVQVFPVQELEASLMRPRTYEALLFGEVFSRDPDPFAFWHTSQLKDPGLNIAMYSNRRVDQLLEDSRQTTDPVLREEKYKEFQKIVTDELGAIFLYSPLHYYVIRDTFTKVLPESLTLLEERFDEIHTWYSDTKRVLK